MSEGTDIKQESSLENSDNGIRSSQLMDYPILPPYPGSGGPIAFPGLHPMQHPHEHGNPLFVSTFGHNHRGGIYDYRGGQMTGSHHMTAAPPKSPSPPPRVYKPCVVCNDKSSGYHYGVSSCEGCKGFFRRSVQKNIEYTCQKESNCEISKVTRNRCQHCRLKKCFEKGMSKEAVRNDRKKKTAEGSTDSTKTNGLSAVKTESVTAASCLTEKDQKLIDVILDAHRQTLPGGPSASKKLKGESPNPSVASPVPSTCSNGTGGDISDNKASPDTTNCEMMGASSPATPMTPGSCGGSPSIRPGWDNVDELNSEGIVKVVEFAKRIPRFLELTVTDQITLLKAACLEVLILRLAMKYESAEGTLTFSNGVSVNKSEMERGGFGPLAHTIFSFSSSLCDMKVDESQFALLSAVCLLASDRSGLECSSDVEKVQEPFLTALQNYSRQLHPKQPHLFAKMLMKLTDLRSISIKGADKVLHLRTPENMPPLLKEMFERPENVCIP